jgi:hypothetical protein
MNLYHAWNREGGYNISRPGSSDYEDLGEIVGKIYGKITGKINGKISGPINGKIGGRLTGPINGRKNVESGHLACVRSEGGKTRGPILGKKWGPINIKIVHCWRHRIRRGKPCTCGNHMPTELA